MEEGISAIKNKRNQNNNRNNQQGSYNNRENGNNQNKKQDKKKGKTSSNSNYDSITFCNKKGHTQIDCRSRILQKKPLTWKNKEIKSKFHSKMIMDITDFGDM